MTDVTGWLFIVNPAGQAMVFHVDDSLVMPVFSEPERAGEYVARALGIAGVALRPRVIEDGPGFLAMTLTRAIRLALDPIVDEEGTVCFDRFADEEPR